MHRNYKTSGFYEAARRAAGQLWVVSDDEEAMGEEELGEGGVEEAGDGRDVPNEEEFVEDDVFGFGFGLEPEDLD